MKRRHHWSEDAACVGYPDDVFFPPPGKQPNRTVGLAKQVCAGCTVQIQCLTMALDLERDASSRRYGIYGGLTPIERIRLEDGAA